MGNLQQSSLAPDEQIVGRGRPPRDSSDVSQSRDVIQPRDSSDEVDRLSDCRRRSVDDVDVLRLTTSSDAEFLADAVSGRRRLSWTPDSVDQRLAAAAAGEVERRLTAADQIPADTSSVCIVDDDDDDDDGYDETHQDCRQSSYLRDAALSASAMTDGEQRQCDDDGAVKTPSRHVIDNNVHHHTDTCCDVITEHVVTGRAGERSSLYSPSADDDGNGSDDTVSVEPWEWWDSRQDSFDDDDDDDDSDDSDDVSGGTATDDDSTTSDSFALQDDEDNATHHVTFSSTLPRSFVVQQKSADRQLDDAAALSELCCPSADAQYRQPGCQHSTDNCFYAGNDDLEGRGSSSVSCEPDSQPLSSLLTADAQQFVRRTKECVDKCERTLSPDDDDDDDSCVTLTMDSQHRTVQKNAGETSRQIIEGDTGRPQGAFPDDDRLTALNRLTDVTPLLEYVMEEYTDASCQHESAVIQAGPGSSAELQTTSSVDIRNGCTWHADLDRNTRIWKLLVSWCVLVAHTELSHTKMCTNFCSL